METNFKKGLFLLTIFFVGFLNVALAEDNQPVLPYVKMHFASAINSKYAFLIMGAEEGEYTLDWGNGKTFKGKLHTKQREYKVIQKDKTLLSMEI